MNLGLASLIQDNKQSQNLQYKRNQEVEAVTQSTAPHITYTIACYESNKNRFQLQADVEVSPQETTNNIGTVAFEEASPGETMWSSNADPQIAKVDSTPEIDLSGFLSRPVTIDSTTWSTTDTTGLKYTLKPWYLYMNNAAVKNKLANYAFIRAKLHVKCVINATPFQYGLMRACYSPLLGLVSDKIRTTAGNAGIVRIPYSQQPGFYIEPAKNLGGEMECPFFYHKNWLNLSSATDAQQMGTLNFVIFAPLAVAVATATTSVTVQTVAWLTDVELMGSTSKLVLQSDEYGNGPISKPATAIANVASMLTHVPVLGKFATATQIGASAVSKIAAMFGFTNPPNINNVEPMYLMSAPHLATAEISVPYQKLTLDPKTELSVDPTPFGLPDQDELCLNYLKKKESFLGATTWSTSDFPSTKLWCNQVCPTLCTSVALGSAPVKGYKTYHTPLSYLSYLFKHWRGTLKIRVKVVASKYHRGRLKFIYDPLEDTSVSPNLNEVYTKIVDISETDDIILEIPYRQALPWSAVPALDDIGDGWTNGTVVSNLLGFTNGCLSVEVYNALEAPSATSIQLLFYVSAGDDFEFNNPAGYISQGNNWYVPSFFALQGDWSGSTTLCFGERGTASDNRYLMNFGESNISLRKLLRRAQIMDTVQLPTGTTEAINVYRKGISRIPYTPGFVPYAWPTTATKVIGTGPGNYAFNTMHMIPYIANMFLGVRGGVNYTITVNSPKVTSDDIRITRATDTGAVTATNRIIVKQTSIAGTSSLSVKTSRLNAFNYLRDGLAGVAVTSAQAAPSVQFTLPDNNNYNFTLADPVNWDEGSIKDGTDRQAALVTITVANTTTTDEVGYTTLQTAAAAGSDFNCLFFLCVPTIDNLIGDATATP